MTTSYEWQDTTHLNHHMDVFESDIRVFHVEYKNDDNERFRLRYKQKRNPIGFVNMVFNK